MTSPEAPALPTRPAAIAGRDLVVGTRASKLARWQTDYVIEKLRRAWPELRCRTVELSTQGDRLVDRPLPEIGGKGLFTQELEQRLLGGTIDLAVHSLKDLPVGGADGLVVAAVPPREDARDVLIAREKTTVSNLAPAAVIGTSSLRRKAQLLAARRDLVVRPVRGNVETRLAKVRRGEVDAVVLAAAGLLRLGLEEAVSEWLSLEVMLPAPGQGALAVQCLSDDRRTRELLAPLDDLRARQTAECERAFLQGLGGGCSLPVGAHAAVLDSGAMTLAGVVASPRGDAQVRVRGQGQEGAELGARLASEALEQGAREILTEPPLSEAVR